MRKLNSEKIANLSSFNDELDKMYGELGSESRAAFDEEAMAWFYGNMLRERRRELKLTQKQVAEKIGREQSYIARIENGKADIQLSSFFRISALLGIQFAPTFAQAVR